MNSDVISPAELVLNADGSIYHLNVTPNEIANTVILVGDPDRVPMVSQYFDEITTKKQKREFVVHTGRIAQLPISVVSTGIGAGSIDIVINELDALVNVDFTTRQVKEQLTSLRLIRLGTCGGLMPDIALGSRIVSQYAICFDGLLNYYQRDLSSVEQRMLAQVQKHFHNVAGVSHAAITSGSESLLHLFAADALRGITITCPGFYAPQGRRVRAPIRGENMLDLARNFEFNGMPVTNFEMETADIYGLGSLLGHECCSISTILANRAKNEFMDDSRTAVAGMIEWALERISK